MEAGLDSTSWGLPGVPEVSKYDGAACSGSPRPGANKQEAVAATMNHVMGKFFTLVTERIVNTASVEIVLDTLEAILTTMRASTHVHDVRAFVQSLTTAVNISENLDAAMPVVQTPGGCRAQPPHAFRPEQRQQAARINNADLWEPGKEDLPLLPFGSADGPNFRWELPSRQADVDSAGSTANKVSEESSNGKTTCAISMIEEKLRAHFSAAQQLLLQDLAVRQEETLQLVTTYLEEEFGLSVNDANLHAATASGNLLRGVADVAPRKQSVTETAEGPPKQALALPGQPSCQAPGRSKELDRADSERFSIQASGPIGPKEEVPQQKRQKGSILKAPRSGFDGLMQINEEELPRSSLQTRNSSVSSDEVIRLAGSKGDDDMNHVELSTLPHKIREVKFSSSGNGENDDDESALKSQLTRSASTVTFTLLDIWKKERNWVARNADRAKAMDVTMQMQATLTQRMDQEDMGLNSTSSRVSGRQPSMRVNDAKVTCHVPMLHPNSKIRTFWDLGSLSLVVYDMIAIPFGFFEPPESRFLEAMAWVTRIFWTIDMPFTFFTGQVLSDGTIEMRPTQIAKRYLRTWFLLDVVINGSDWLEVIINASTDISYARMGKASRIFRIVRLIRLLRLMRMGEVVKQMVERIHSEALLIMADCAKIMLFIIGLAHIIACFWYGVGHGADGKNNWLDAHEEYHDSSLGYKYTSTLHWSLQQFGGGTDEVVPQNVAERVYAIFVWIFAFMVASIFMGRLTSSMTRLSFLGNQHNQQLSHLRKYLGQIGISRRLALRVQRNAQHAMREQQKFEPEQNVEMLDKVSDPLRMEMHFETYSPTFRVHPFFQMYIDVCPQVMMKVCHQAAGMQFVSAGDTIFHAGEADAESKMLIICKGELLYAPIYGERADVLKDDWVSEACLWTEWIHQGVLIACNNCRICLLDSQLFQEISSRFSGNEFDPRPYAAAFVLELNERAQNPENGDLTDLPMGCEPAVVSKLVNKAKHAHGGQSSNVAKWWGRPSRNPAASRATRMLQGLQGRSK